MQCLLGFGLRRLGQLVQNVSCLVDPAALVAHSGKDLIRGSPEAQCTVTDTQLRHVHATLLKFQ